MSTMHNSWDVLCLYSDESWTVVDDAAAKTEGLNHHFFFIYLCHNKNSYMKLI